MDISKKILSDPINKWIFSNAGTEVYLVGGYIRDILIGRDAHDKDYVLKSNAKQTSEIFAKKFKGTFIELKEELTYRVALKDGQFIDFNFLDKKIEGDLLLRDYTINAVAWSPEKGIIDPTGGISSLKKKQICTVNPYNILSDPLRVLRAYRIAAQLNFTIEANTRAHLKKYSRYLINAAPERITEELYKLLNTPKIMKYLKLCAQDGVFKAIFGLTTRNININLGIINKFDEFVIKSNKIEELSEPVSQGLSKLGLIRISLLLQNEINCAEPDYFKWIRPSNIISQKMSEIREGGKTYEGRISDSKLYEIFRAAGTSVSETALIMSSMKKGTREKTRFINKAKDYLRITKKHMIDGNEIQKILDINEGARIGMIQEKIREGQFKGLIKSRSKAREWIISNFT